MQWAGERGGRQGDAADEFTALEKGAGDESWGLANHATESGSTF